MFNKTLLSTDSRYSIYKKEMLAMIKSLQHFRIFILGCKIFIFTDQLARKWLKMEYIRYREDLILFDAEIF